MSPRTFVLLIAPFVVANSLGQPAPIPKEMDALFQQLDTLGRGSVRDARFVELAFDGGSEKAWVVSEDDTEVVVIGDDLVPWTYSKRKATRVPSSWHPRDVTLKEIKPTDFEQFCQVCLRFIPSSLLGKDLRISSGTAQSATMNPHRIRTEELQWAS